MLHGKSSHELGLASTAVLVHLLQRLVHEKLLERHDALTILDNAASELVSDPAQTTEHHRRAAQLIRNELVLKL